MQFFQQINGELARMGSPSGGGHNRKSGRVPAAP